MELKGIQRIIFYLEVAEDNLEEPNMPLSGQYIRQADIVKAWVIPHNNEVSRQEIIDNSPTGEEVPFQLMIVSLN